MVDNDLVAFPPPEQVSFPILWGKQLLVMLKADATLTFVRYWRSALLTILAPIVFLALLYMIEQLARIRGVTQNLHPVAYDLNSLRPCIPGAYPTCVKFMFSPDTDETRGIMQFFDQYNTERGGYTDESTFTVTPLSEIEIPSQSSFYATAPDENYIYNMSLTYPNLTEYAIIFTREENNFQYLLWYNTTQTSNTTLSISEVYGLDLISVMRLIDEAILRYIAQEAGDQPIRLNTMIKDWPTDSIAGLYLTVVSRANPLFFFCSCMINFMLIINTIVSEKEYKLRHGMQMMGLISSVYWTSWLLINTVVVILTTFVICAAGYAFQIDFFVNSSFSVIYCFFFMFQASMIFVAFFISSLVPKVRTGTLLGMFILIIGLVFMLAIFGSTYTGYLWWQTTTSKAGWLVLMFLPFFNFGKLYIDIDVLTLGQYDASTNTIIAGPGFTWSSLYQQIPSEYLSSIGTYDLPLPAQSLLFLFMNMGFYALLAWYFDNVLPDVFGNRKPVYFFLTPSFWGYHHSNRRSYDLAKLLSKSEKIQEDDDVHDERLAALDDSKSKNAAVRLLHLRKVFGGNIFQKNSGKAAVEGSSWTLQEGQLLALLGQNGAGKTTTINMLCGFSKPTSGEAFIFGKSIRNEMTDIRSMMGVCPQHDILFQDLTAAEHIELFAGIKNVPRSALPKLIEERLGAVRLLKVKDKNAGSFSGGMKRRLSVAISTIGDPKIVFMDEPTTGMDPVNRRHVWGFIERFKRGRAIILTTHSMEEADILGDDIAIMALGKLRAFGSAIHLKGKFGAGYRISIVTEPDKSAGIQEDISNRIPGAILEDSSAGALIFMIPNDSMRYVADVVSDLENQKMSGVKEWGISQSTLEEVFLKIIREVNPTKEKK